MRERNKYKNENQIKLDFQMDRGSFPKKEKGLNPLAQSLEASKAGRKETAQFVSAGKEAKSVQFAGASKTTAFQPKSLSKKSSESKVRKTACGHKKPSGLLFDNLITVEELAVIFRLAPQTIRNWIALGKIPYVRIGRRSFFQQRSLQKWLNQKEEPQWQ